MKSKKLNYKKQKQMFARTSGSNTAKAINKKPAPARGGWRN